jgi:hypothetical protein
MVCNKGHDSEAADFCSVCGVRMPAADPAVQAPVKPVETCPDCALAREPGSGNFCEFCGYNFTTREHGEMKPGHASPAQPTVPEQPAVPEPQIQREWEVLVEVDASLRAEESPDAPAGFRPVTIRLTAESSLIGRRSEKRGVFPDISLDLDDAVSHRHAFLNRLPDGALVVRDIGSSNGTRLNGVELKPLTDAAVKAGDQLTLGHWTRITIRASEEEHP